MLLYTVLGLCAVGTIAGLLRAAPFVWPVVAIGAVMLSSIWAIGLHA